MVLENSLRCNGSYFALIPVVVSLAQAERALLNHPQFQRLTMW